MMIRLLDKASEQKLLGHIFDLLHENMKEIAPSELSYDAEKEEWLSCVGPALQKPSRQILLIFEAGALAGFCMYYVNSGVFMVEELQLRKSAQKTTQLLTVIRYLARIIPEDTAFIEAYADRRNTASQNIIRRLGMQPVGETPDGRCLHYRGCMDDLFRKFGSKKVPE